MQGWVSAPGRNGAACWFANTCALVKAACHEVNSTKWWVVLQSHAVINRLMSTIDLPVRLEATEYQGQEMHPLDNVMNSYCVACRQSLTHLLATVCASSSSSSSFFNVQFPARQGSSDRLDRSLSRRTRKQSDTRFMTAS